MKNRGIIHFLAAADRVNYGDLLFPIVFNEIANKNNYDVYYYGLVKSDFRHFGGLPTESYKMLHKNIKKLGGTIIIGGGDVFFANWETLYSYINPLFVKLMKYRFLRKVNAKLKIIDTILHKKNVMLPLTPGVFEFNTPKSLQVVYNGVGGTFNENNTLDYNKKIVERLHSSNHISVRDNRTLNSLKKFKVNAVLTPDSAIIMSDVFPKAVLENKITIDKENIPKNYFFLQFGHNKAPNNFKETAQKIEVLAKNHNVKIILCPIGLALKHEDDKELMKMEKYSSHFQFVMPKNIFDIMWLIANSKAYMGTSLHGALTAQSYHVPFFSLNKKIKKADSYFKTWCPEISKGCIDFEDIDCIDDALGRWSYKKNNTYLDEQKELVYKNFEVIFSKIGLI
ncbi:polysaccharide pyruvyl transferase family protein [Flaviramulus sp. BrNp1-15]|uniref:polysaccharide pyruvyl transferase family protein n=1 Tax=Flaviramulus sp. BrNp1-15 TaxID=2916754 RepID=UPI001EE93416|nr:polysaccharide pyruvyl transferase family protein [Flaviramulus sp. BrNp1-15]ULC60571.1 polysaccharide pyruvyl transferase family protein [Flaviramulus sp. BrNp1-15]